MNIKENQLVTDQNQAFSVAMLSVLGDREEQQDSFGYYLKNEEGIVAICDGMGGHAGGKLASETAVGCIINSYVQKSSDADMVKTLLDAAREADTEVVGLRGESGQPLKAGSTLVSVVIQRDRLLWCSVGDSRAYLLRNGEFVQLTQDQNYLTVIKERRNAGLISEEEYEIEKDRGEALISFLGIGNLSLIDYSEQVFKLLQDDKLILMSDGLYKTVSDEEILRILDNFNNLADAASALDMKAKKNAKTMGVSRDNTTIAIIKIK